jgi:hypothetical protein
VPHSRGPFALRAEALRLCFPPFSGQTEHGWLGGVFDAPARSNLGVARRPAARLLVARATVFRRPTLRRGTGNWELGTCEPLSFA